MDAALVLQTIQEYCDAQQPGAVVPSHNKWMSQLNASERSVRWALAELQRQGKIICRPRGRTYVAEPDLSNNGHTGENFGVRAFTPRHDKENNTIVAVATPDHSFFDRAIELLFSQAKNSNLSLVCRPIEPSANQLPLDGNPLGYLLFKHDLAPLAQTLQSAGHRVVLFATPLAGDSFGVPTVRSDQELGGYLAARHLIQQGHRRIAFQGSGTPETFHASLRGRGHERAIQEAATAGISIESSFISDQEFEMWRLNFQRAKEFWAKTDAPTAVAVWNDHEAIFFMSFLAYIGIRVPEQVSIIGYDNLPAGEKASPALSTVDGDLERQLQAAISILKSPHPVTPDHVVVVPPSLIRRDSSAPAKQVF